MAKAGANVTQLRLRLYVAGRAPNSSRALANLEAICNEHFSSAYQLEIIDVLEDAKAALRDGVIVTPTLIRLSPEPIAKIIGTLSDTEQVLLALVAR